MSEKTNVQEEIKRIIEEFGLTPEELGEKFGEIVTKCSLSPPDELAKCVLESLIGRKEKTQEEKVEEQTEE